MFRRVTPLITVRRKRLPQGMWSIIADLIGIARLDIEANTLGSLAVVGVFDVVKAEGAIPSGSTVYWDAGAKKATTVSGSNHYLGKAIAAAEAADDTVRVLLNAPYSLATTFAAAIRSRI